MTPKEKTFIGGLVIGAILGSLAGATLVASLLVDYI